MGVKLWSLAISNMFVLVLTLLATVAANPLPSQESSQPSEETTQVSPTEDLAVEASNQFKLAKLAILAAANAGPTAINRSPGYGKRSVDSKDESEGAQDEVEAEELAVGASSLQTSQLRVAAAARLAILAAANAQPTAVISNPGYGKRSADGEEEVEVDVLDEEASSLQSSQLRVPAAARLAILAAANAKPTAVISNPGYGKRSADSKDDSETKLGLVDNIPLEAVKVVIHSSRGNIVQHYGGDTEYQNAVLGSRFGRGKRETENFIPFSEYDTRRVNTLKLEQNDFLALPARLQSQYQEKKKRHFSES